MLVHFSWSKIEKLGLGQIYCDKFGMKGVVSYYLKFAVL
jgi:hypothetical protein